MLPVLIPFDDEARGLLKELATTEQVGEIARRLQPYVVQVPPGQFARLCAAGVVQPVAQERFGEQFWRLVNRRTPSVCIEPGLMRPLSVWRRAPDGYRRHGLESKQSIVSSESSDPGYAPVVD